MAGQHEDRAARHHQTFQQQQACRSDCDCTIHATTDQRQRQLESQECSISSASSARASVAHPSFSVQSGMRDAVTQCNLLETRICNRTCRWLQGIRPFARAGGDRSFNLLYVVGRKLSYRHLRLLNQKLRNNSLAQDLAS